MKRVVIIPTDPVIEYDKKGTSQHLKHVFNPDDFFDEVYILSPKESKFKNWNGFKIIPVISETDFKRKLNKINPNFLRVYGGHWPVKYAVKCKIDHIPIICSVHDARDSYFQEELLKVDAVIAVSDLLGEKLTKIGVERNKITQIGNRINYDLFRPLETSHKEVLKLRSEIGDYPILLFVGRLSSEKNLDSLIKALPFIKSKYRLVVIGQGDKTIYQDLAKDHKVIDNIIFINSVQNDYLNYWYNACDIFVVLSRFEGFGVVYIEAVASGAKIITSDIEPLRSLLSGSNDQVVLIKDYEDPKIIAKQIDININHQTVYTSLREKQLSIYSIEAVCTKEKNFYNSLLNKSEYKLNGKRYFKSKKYLFEYMFLSIKNRIYRFLSI